MKRFSLVLAVFLPLVFLASCFPFRAANYSEEDMLHTPVPVDPSLYEMPLPSQSPPPLPSPSLDGPVLIASVFCYGSRLESQRLGSQVYKYDEEGRLTGIFAPEGYLVRISDAHHMWSWFFDHEIREVSETYEYDGDGRLSRVVGHGPMELYPDDDVTYEITMEYDEQGTEVRETLHTADGDTVLELNYENDRIIIFSDDSDGFVSYDYDEDARLSLIVNYHILQDDVVDVVYDYKDDVLLRVICFVNQERLWRDLYEYDEKGNVYEIEREYADPTLPIRTLRFVYDTVEASSD